MYITAFSLSTLSGRFFLHWYIMNNVDLWMLTQKKMELEMEKKNVVIVVIVHSMTEWYLFILNPVEIKK